MKNFKRLLFSVLIGLGTASVVSAAAFLSSQVGTGSPTNGYVLVAPGSAGTPAAWQSIGTVISPGGSNTQVQYNDAATFGGISKVTTNGVGFTEVGMDLVGSTTGDTYFLQNGVLTRLGIGSSNQGLVVSGGLPSWQSIVNSITGTASQIIASAATGNITLSLPQNIATSSSPTFTAETLTGANSLTLGTASTHTGSIILNDASNSAQITLQPGTTSSSYTFTLPTTGGTNGYVLSTNGSGTTTWVAQSGGGSPPFTLTNPGTLAENASHTPIFGSDASGNPTISPGVGNALIGFDIAANPFMYSSSGSPYSRFGFDSANNPEILNQGGSVVYTVDSNGNAAIYGPSNSGQTAIGFTASGTPALGTQMIQGGSGYTAGFVLDPSIANDAEIWASTNTKVFGAAQGYANFGTGNSILLGASNYGVTIQGPLYSQDGNYGANLFVITGSSGQMEFMNFGVTSATCSQWTDGLCTAP